MNLIEKVFGTHSERELKMIYPIVDKIEAMRSEMMELSDEQLRDRTRIFKERLAAGETLDDILPEAFAAVREAARINVRILDFFIMTSKKQSVFKFYRTRRSRMPRRRPTEKDYPLTAPIMTPLTKYFWTKG